MTRDIAELLKKHSDSEETEIREDYSGRGMMGKSTYAVTFDSQGDFESALAGAAEHIEALTDSFAKDSMGLGIVVY